MMKLLFTIAFALITESVFSQGELQAEIIGKWMMSEVTQEGEDVSTEHNPKGNRFIIFKTDGTFESGGDPYGKNTGKYYVDESKSRLMLDSHAGEGDDSMWTMELLENGGMKWTGIGSEWAESFVITHIRSKE